MYRFGFDFENVSPDLWISNEKVLKEKLLQLPSWSQIPLINSNASHNLPDNSMVRFRGMIQDMRNPEFYFESFEVYNTVTNEVKMKSGKYRDTADILENEKINYTTNLKSAERLTVVAVSMPGLNKWVQDIENKENHLKHLEQQPNTTKRLGSDSGVKLKRSYDEVAEDDPDAMDVDAVNKSSNKELKTEENVDEIANVVSREHLLNFPLPDVSSQSCLIKIYDDNDNLKLNDMVEIVGFLSVDPSLSGEFHKNETMTELHNESEAEIITHNPPPSLVPRIHAVYVKKLDHYNPLLVDTFDKEFFSTSKVTNDVIEQAVALIVEYNNYFSKDEQQLQYLLQIVSEYRQRYPNCRAVLNKANAAREHLLKALTELLLGDKLAAEYLICHLISSVYHRQDTLALGKFCLNLSNVPTQKYPKYGEQLYDIIKQFVTKSYYLAMSLSNMNTLALLPKKDYECNRLTSGILQLSKNTHLILDETKLEQGRLDSIGVGNVAALGHLIQHQKVEYDFKYYKMEFESDIPVLILSEGKSLLPSDFHVPLRPEESSLEIFDAIIEAATYYLKEEIMNTIRSYLTNVKLVKYSITEDLQFVENDFIEMRTNSSLEDPVTADDLHRLLVLARLVSLSRGYDTLNKECWEISKNMEKERMNRVKNRETSTI